ncbi:hypothetical protein [Azospirillum aestuarii]|uniref:hypothetical protein n=1 Tax=Azospirillum aestuarii TaxID=2802052 RepID=UPI004054D94A
MPHLHRSLRITIRYVACHRNTTATLWLPQMLIIRKNNDICASIDNYSRLRNAPIAQEWNEHSAIEAKIHRIHAYPAKFPAFLVKAAFDYAQSEGVQVARVADVFCGCGTVAYETASRGAEFWGCDINPVATLIARVKAMKIDPRGFDRHVESIIERFATASDSPSLSEKAISRLIPWYDDAQFNDLARLSNAIDLEAGASTEYGMALRCAFSAIVKSTSRWRSRSTKPTKDFAKLPRSVLQTFVRQCRFMSRAWSENNLFSQRQPQIIQGNVTSIEGPKEPVDLIVTSPPYVTSYEYADLHQLSALWLGYADDHRTMRNGIIGTVHRRAELGAALRDLNAVGNRIVFSLFDKNRPLAESVAAYFLDIQIVARRCYEFLRPGGIGVFVIGNTKLHGISVDNTNHMVESLLNVGFSEIRAAKRIMMNKANTPFRMPDGKLSSSPTGMDVYGNEYILMARRP